MFIINILKFNLYLKMGPKKDDTSKKVEKKNQARVIDDKTFGLKNKNKSKVVQK